MTPKKESNLNLAVSLVIKSLMRTSGKTLRELHEEIGVTISSLSRTINFERAATFVEICLLCDCFKISLLEFQDLVNNKMRDTVLLNDFKTLKAIKKDLRERM